MSTAPLGATMADDREYMLSHLEYEQRRANAAAPWHGWNMHFDAQELLDLVEAFKERRATAGRYWKGTKNSSGAGTWPWSGAPPGAIRVPREPGRPGAGPGPGVAPPGPLGTLIIAGWTGHTPSPPPPLNHKPWQFWQLRHSAWPALTRTV